MFSIMDLRKLYEIGNEKNVSSIIKLEIIIVNLISIFGAFLGVFYTIYFLYLKEHNLALPYFLCFILYVSVLILNYRQRFNLAKHLTILTGCITVGVTILFFGKDAQSQVFLALLLGFAAILMKNRTVFILYAMIIFAIFIGVFYNENTFGTKYQNYRFIYDDYFNFGVAMTAFALFSFLIFKYVRDSFLDLKKANQSLKTNNEELENKNRIIEDQKNEMLAFSDMASHDLKTPSRTVSSYLKLLEKSISDNNTNKTKTYLDFALKGSEQMNKLISGIAGFRNINETESPLAQIDLNHTLVELKKSYTSDSVKIKIQKLPTIIANKKHVGLLFQNLFDNALLFNERENKNVEISFEKKLDNFEINVEDNGIGIDESFYDLVFEPFKKLHPNHVYDTVGLGLAFCKKIITFYKGDIEIKSSGENGTTFVLRFPNSMLV